MLEVYSSVDLDKHHWSTSLHQSLYRCKLPSHQLLLFGIFCCLFQYQRRLPALLHVSGLFISWTHIQHNSNTQNRRCDFRGAPSSFWTSIAAATQPTYVWWFICPITNQAHIQALQWIIRHLQCKIQTIQDIINQLWQEEDPNVIIIEAEPLFFDDDDPIQFKIPPALLQQDTEAILPHPNLGNASIITVTNHPNPPAMQQEQIQEARHRAREWAAEQYPSQA